MPVAATVYSKKAYADTFAQLSYDNSIMCCCMNEGHYKGDLKNENLFVFRESRVVTFARMIDYFHTSRTSSPHTRLTKHTAS